MSRLFSLIFLYSSLSSCGSDEPKRSCSAYIKKVCEVTAGFPEGYDFERVGASFTYMINKLEDAVPSKCSAPKMEDLDKGAVKVYTCSHKINGKQISGHNNYDIQRDGSGFLKCNLRGVENVFISFNESTEQAFLNIAGQESAMSCSDRAAAISGD